MEHTPAKVLPFPVASPVPPPRLLPDWEVMHLHFLHELGRIHRLGPAMSANEVLRLQGEWSLLALALDAVEASVKFRVAAHAKAAGLIATVVVEVLPLVTV